MVTISQKKRKNNPIIRVIDQYTAKKVHVIDQYTAKKDFNSSLAYTNVGNEPI